MGKKRVECQQNGYVREPRPHEPYEKNRNHKSMRKTTVVGVVVRCTRMYVMYLFMCTFFLFWFSNSLYEKHIIKQWNNVFFYLPVDISHPPLQQQQQQCTRVPITYPTYISYIREKVISKTCPPVTRLLVR